MEVFCDRSHIERGRCEAWQEHAMMDEREPVEQTPNPTSPEPQLDAEQERQVREALEAHPLLTREKAIRMLREFGF